MAAAVNGKAKTSESSTSTKEPVSNGDSKKVSATSPSPSVYDEVDNLKKLCDFLRSRQGPAIREALLMEKRVYYLKGEKLVNFLCEPKKGTKWPSNLPKFKSRYDAIAVCKDLCKNHFMIRCDKHGKGELTLSRVRDFDEAGYFAWVYEGDKTMSHLLTFALIFGFLFCVCFPIWPQFLRVWVWYLSVTFLLVVFIFVTVRAFLFLFIWILGYEFWFLPNLFDETLSVIDSFKPIYSFEPTKEGQLHWRIGVAVAFSSFCWWAVTQPSEFDHFIVGQGDFLKDLYAGKLLSDISAQDKANIDKPKMQSLDDLLKSLEVEEEDETDLNFGDVEVDEEEKVDSLLDNLVDQDDDHVAVEED